jgi:nucleoside-diphosphate kinase
MHNNLTCAIIKPDAVMAKKTGIIIELIEANRFEIVAIRKVHISREQAEQFYAVHVDKPFFAELVEYVTSGPVVVMALRRENAIETWRTLMGATNPAQASVGTLRYMFGTAIGSNATHGSDSDENAVKELKLFFTDIV